MAMLFTHTLFLRLPFYNWLHLCSSQPNTLPTTTITAEPSSDFKQGMIADAAQVCPSAVPTTDHGPPHTPITRLWPAPGLATGVYLGDHPRIQRR